MRDECLGCACCSSTRLQASIGSLVVPSDSGEAVESIALLKSLDLTDVIVTGDAAFSFAKLAKTIRDRGAHYFLFVKGNQPELHAEFAHSFGDDSPLKARQRAGPKPASH
jgi:predicted transposase YbfD/YdcC